MNTFEKAFRNESHLTTTENGAVALNTTSDPCLDLFATIGALRNADKNRIETLVAEAYKADPLLAPKIIFYARDIRGGLGERDTFRTALRYLAIHHPEAIKKNIWAIGELYGRYDDLYFLVGTPLERIMWYRMAIVFKMDLDNMSKGGPVSLLAKWIKTPDASSKTSRKMGIYTAQKLGYSVYDFKRKLRKLRKYLKIVETNMSANKWNEIEYSGVPSKAMHIYSNAFERHDESRFNNYIEGVTKGKAKINTSTLYPYELYEKYDKGRCSSWYDTIEDPVVEAQWKALPNYVQPGTNAIVMADTSGSMNGRPMATSVSLALYFAERNVGAYHNLWMSFSSNPNIHEVKGETLLQKIQNMDRSDWGMSTDLEKAIQTILLIAINNHVPSEELPKSLIVISDMEINRADYGRYNGWTFYDIMKAQYAEHGYEIPNIIFWNVDSRHDVFHTDSTRKGVQLVSGSSPTVFKHVMNIVDSTPREAMLKVINSERYSHIKIS